MALGSFSSRPKGLFDRVNQLNFERQTWATEQLQRTHGNLSNYDSVYDTTKLNIDNQLQVASKLDAAADEATLATLLAETGLQNYNSDRQSSKRGKASQAFQESMTVFANFLESFSGIVDIVRAADEQYGGLAYGTLSVLLGVFVRKTQREEGLIEGFEELSYAFPRLQTLKKLGQAHEAQTTEEYEATAQLEKLLTETFALVIEFAREATQYYASRTRRLKDTFVPERIKSTKLLQIRSHLKKVRGQCDTLMLTQISSMRARIDEMNIRLKRIDKGVAQTERLALRTDTAESQTHESKLKRLLGINQESANTGSDTLAALESLINDSFSRLKSATAHPKVTSIDLLKADVDFCRWWESRGSCLFMAGGVNWREESSTGSLNWLSMGALQVIKELQDQKQCVAHYLVQTSFLIGKPHRRSLRDVMAHLIFQIALMREDSLRAEYDTLKTTVRSQLWNENDADNFMEAACVLLLSILSAFTQDQQLWIVIDRLDQCSWDDGYEDDRIDFQAALKNLLEMLSEACCCVKVLLVVDAPSAGNSARLSKSQKRCLIVKPQWRQETEPGRI